MQMRRGERMASIAPLLSGICHELNNPLTSIQSFAELLLLDERPAADREALEIMQREAHRAAAIVSDLRVVARRSQEVGSSRGLVDLNEVVETAVREHRDALGAVGAHVDCDLTPDLPAAWAVRAQIAQVVGHLLSNAEQAVRDASAERRITLRTFRSEHGVALAVTDTGPGIGPEHHDRIFDPFWTTRQAGEGAGLGLSLVHSIVADHEGRIRLDSAPGLGATFTIDLPFAERAPVAEEECDSDSAASRGLRGVGVDDEAANPVSHISYQQRRGPRLAEASEGGAALRLLDEASERPAFDVIIADLRMPGLGGDALLERLRERNEGLEQRVVFITGDADGPDAAALLQDPSIPVIWKPFELAEVTQVAEAQAGLAG
jgi:CheY-like chemotaxis protein/two-component sensor histidine kinase